MPQQRQAGKKRRIGDDGTDNDYGTDDGDGTGSDDDTTDADAPRHAVVEVTTFIVQSDNEIREQ